MLVLLHSLVWGLESRASSGGEPRTGKSIEGPHELRSISMVCPQDMLLNKTSSRGHIICNTRNPMSMLNIALQSLTLTVVHTGPTTLSVISELSKSVPKLLLYHKQYLN